MRSRVAFIQSFRDTQNFIKENEQLREETLHAMAATTLYLEDYEAFLPSIKCQTPKIRVIEDTTFHCAQGLLSKTNAALL